MITDEDGEDYDDDELTREQKKINGMAARVTWEITFFLEFNIELHSMIQWQW